MANNVIPIRPVNGQGFPLVAPSGQALTAETTAQIINDYRSSATAWKWISLGLATVASWQYYKYVVRPAKRSASRLTSARAALG